MTTLSGMAVFQRASERRHAAKPTSGEVCYSEVPLAAWQVQRTSAFPPLRVKMYAVQHPSERTRLGHLSESVERWGNRLRQMTGTRTDRLGAVAA